MPALTAAAARQIRDSAAQTGAQDMALRVAATRRADGSLHYAIGFDDVGGETDRRFTSQGVELVVAPSSLELVRELVIDYAELDSGELAFIFRNPADPAYRPPT